MGVTQWVRFLSLEYMYTREQIPLSKQDSIYFNI